MVNFNTPKEFNKTAHNNMTQTFNVPWRNLKRHKSEWWCDNKIDQANDWTKHLVKTCFPG